MKTRIMIVMIVLALTVPVFAGDWFGPTDSWNTASKWGWYYTVPNPLEAVNVYQGLDNYPIISNGISAKCNEIYIGFYSGDGRVDMTGGSLAVGTGMVLGTHDGFYGEFNMSGGTVTLGTHLYIGLSGGTTGTLNMTGGTMTLNTLVMAHSTSDHGMVLNIGGDATLSALDSWIDTTGKALINISDNGTLILNGDQISNWRVPDLEYYGTLTANGGTGTLVYDYNITNPGKTTITAIPEPMTLTLLGIGLLCVRRRRA